MAVVQPLCLSLEEGLAVILSPAPCSLGTSGMEKLLRCLGSMWKCKLCRRFSKDREVNVLMRKKMHFHSLRERKEGDFLV